MSLTSLSPFFLGHTFLDLLVFRRLRNGSFCPKFFFFLNRLLYKRFGNSVFGRNLLIDELFRSRMGEIIGIV
ncbi:hypothetical protein RclHR1_16600003 [Rhizophagus clarus]|uniref:Uncharacterized protein n=1 Tax=Rhizophagus clarus TaxID=94130 RepID=A0A2Z6QI06_9GLOM|nr:hypothetical protein RclHR1_16600003 [Rhizophagus clarus]